MAGKGQWVCWFGRSVRVAVGSPDCPLQEAFGQRLENGAGAWRDRDVNTRPWHYLCLALIGAWILAFPGLLCVHVSWGPSVVPECLHHHLNSLGQLPGRLLPNWFLPENPLFNKIIFRRATKQIKTKLSGWTVCTY